MKEIFIKGNCRNVSNITALGDAVLSIGQFSNAESAIGIKEGIIISTGAIELALGPNIEDEAGFPFELVSNDPDLSQLATDELYDVTGIEFDFVPLDARVTFRYVFASEEYCEFVGTSFNDVFGFFVSGPGINGDFNDDAINVATLFTTGENVSINNVNHLSNELFYVSNVTTIDAEKCEIDHDPTFQELIEYDGFTVPLVASFEVIPCETYRIRLTLGDVGDAYLDSAVFLEANSFDLGEKTQLRAEVLGRDEPVAYEGCADGQFVFTRSSLNRINEDCTVEFMISPESEATNGIDFVEIPLSVTIPAGDTSFVLPITVLEDNIPEGPETLKLAFEYDCDCIDPVFSELTISEATGFSVSFGEIVVCPGQTFSISPEVAGGVPPLTFRWATGATTDTLTGSLSAPTQYTVTVTDFCGNADTAVANIGVQNTPSAILAGTYDLCETATTGIPVVLEGNPPWVIGYSIDGAEQALVEDIQTTPFYLNTPTEGTYLLTTFNDAYCSGNPDGSATVAYGNFRVEAEAVAPSCASRMDGSIVINELEAIAPFSIQWSVPTQDDYLIDKLGEGVYVLQITDGNNCQYERVFDLRADTDDVEDCLRYYIPNVFSPNNDGINDVFSIFVDEFSGLETIVSFQVYSRWGALLFEQNDFTTTNGNMAWRGDSDGKPLDVGVYVYKIVMAFEDGSTLLVSGDVTLLR